MLIILRNNFYRVNLRMIYVEDVKNIFSCNSGRKLINILLIIQEKDFPDKSLKFKKSSQYHISVGTGYIPSTG